MAVAKPVLLGILYASNQDKTHKGEFQLRTLKELLTAHITALDERLRARMTRV
jgi:hypothetical protein